MSQSPPASDVAASKSSASPTRRRGVREGWVIPPRRKRRPPPVQPDDGRLAENKTPRHYNWLNDFPNGKYGSADVEYMLGCVMQHQVTYAVMRVRGKSITKAAAAVNTTPNTASDWERSPWWEPLCHRERARHYGNREVAVEPLVPLATQTLEAALRGNLGAQVQFDAAKFVYEQRFGKPPAVQVNVVKSDESELATEMVKLMRVAAEANLAYNRQPLLSPATVIDVESQVTVNGGD